MRTFFLRVLCLTLAFFSIPGFAHTNTSNLGRIPIVHPDFGYQGGAGLHTVVSNAFTTLSNNEMFRWSGDVTLANNATTTITHNFTLALTKIKVIIFEAGIQLTAAQVTAGYVIAQVDTASYTVQNVTGSSKVIQVITLATKLGVVAADLDPGVEIDTTGNVRATDLRTLGNSLTINHDAAGSGSDWKANILRNSSSMVADGSYTLPIATDTLLGRASTDTVTNKNLGSSSNTLTGATAASFVNTGTVSLPTATTTLVGRDTTDTLTNKTLTGNTAASFLNSGTVSLPTTTTTLVGRDTTDTLTNKTLTGNEAASFLNSGATVSLPTSTSNLATTALSETFTNKVLDSNSVTTLLRFINQASARFREATGSGSDEVIMQAATSSTTWTFTLPQNDGDSGQVLSTDGTGFTSWTTAATVPIEGGVYSNGTALQTIGAFSGQADEVFAVNSAANGAEYKQILTGTTAVSNNIGVTAGLGNITVQIPDASATVRGVLTTAGQIIGGHKTVNIVDSSQSIVTSAGTTTLIATDPVTTVFTGSTTHTVKLPDTATLSIGYRRKIHNLSISTVAGSVVVQTNTGVVLTSLSGVATINSMAQTGFGATFECVSTADNTAAAWRQVGNNTEWYEAKQTTPTDTGANNVWTDAASFSLGAGLWQLAAYEDFSANGATVSAVLTGISTTSGNSASGLVFGVNAFSMQGPTAVFNTPLYVPATPFVLTSTTTYYMKQKANFSAGTPQSAYVFRATRIK